MRLKQLTANKTTEVCKDILDWVDEMGQGHSNKKNHSFDGTAKRKEEKRLFYLGVKRKRTKSPLKEQNTETPTRKETELQKSEKIQENIHVSNLKEYAKNSEMIAFFKLFGK